METESTKPIVRLSRINGFYSVRARLGHVNILEDGISSFSELEKRAGILVSLLSDDMRIRSDTYKLLVILKRFIRGVAHA